jgi:hypothetical protein
MMGNKSFLIRIWLIIIIIMVSLLVSCSQVRPSSDIKSSTTESSSDIESSPLFSEAIPGKVKSPEPPILAYQDLDRLASSNPAKIDNTGLPITPIEKIHVTGFARDVDIASYNLTVDGLVNHPLNLSYEEILQFTPFSKVVLLICPDFFVDNDEWTGVPVSTILTKTGIKAEAKEVLVYSVDGYSQTLSLQEAQKDGVFLAYKVNGQTLPKDQGYPLRLVIEGVYGGSWAKWVNHIKIK